MLLSDVSVKRPVFATVLNLLLIIFGIVAFSMLSLREYPDIDPPIVSVNTTYTGASANIVETRITQLLEDRISGIEGIKNVTSRLATVAQTLLSSLNFPEILMRQPTMCASESAAR